MTVELVISGLVLPINNKPQTDVNQSFCIKNKQQSLLYSYHFVDGTLFYSELSKRWRVVAGQMIQ